jgi:mRNA interferase MazF
MKKSIGGRRREKRSGDLPYQPDYGHFAWLYFSPHAGTEQAGRRPALILSPAAFNIATGLVMACPITNEVKGSPFEVRVPPGTAATGVVLANQLRSLDWLSRRAAFLNAAPPGVVEEVLAKIEAILRPDIR